MPEKRGMMKFIPSGGKAWETRVDKIPKKIVNPIFPEDSLLRGSGFFDFRVSVEILF